MNIYTFSLYRLCRTPRILVCRPLVQKRQSVGRASRAEPNLSAGQPADALEGTLRSVNRHQSKRNESLFDKLIPEVSNESIHNLNNNQLIEIELSIYKAGARLVNNRIDVDPTDWWQIREKKSHFLIISPRYI